MKHVFLLPLVLTLASAPSAFGAESELFSDAVVASVDGSPITLRDVASRLEPARPLKASEAAHDAEARARLDDLILEQLVAEEAKAKRLSVSDQDVEAYINEVATRNNMTREQLEKTLATRGRKFEFYKQQVRSEILKSKLLSQVVQNGIAVSDREIDEYVNQQSSNGASHKLRLRQIFRSTNGSDPEAARTKMNEALARLEDGDSFKDVAAEFSEGPEAAEGGLLGLVSERDLHANIQEALLKLDEDEHTQIVETPAGLHIFLLEEKEESEAAEANDAARAEARKMLEQQKVQSRISSFLSTDLPRSHVVDRKW